MAKKTAQKKKPEPKASKAAPKAAKAAPKAAKKPTKPAAVAVTKPPVATKPPSKAAAKPAPVKMAPLKLVEEKPALAPEAIKTAPIEAKKAKKKEAPVKVASSGDSDDADPKWMSHFEKTKGKGAIPYNMTMQYEAKTAIEHKTLGWGFILSNVNDRLEVLFKDGIRFLISNYKQKT
jgi:hypothetical protein